MSMNMSVNPQFSMGRIGNANPSHTSNAGSQNEVAALKKQIEELKQMMAAKSQEGGSGLEEDPLMGRLNALQEKLDKVTAGQGPARAGDAGAKMGAVSMNTNQIQFR